MPFQNSGYGGICQGLYALVLFCKLYELAPMHLNVLNLIFHYFFSQLRLRVLQPSSVGPPISSTSQNRIWNVLYEGVVLNQEYCGFSSVLLIYTITYFGSRYLFYCCLLEIQGLLEFFTRTVT